jgi:hypothetical protein
MEETNPSIITRYGGVKKQTPIGCLLSLVGADNNHRAF